MRIKVNANLGTSPDRCSVEEELEKLRAAVDAGAHAVMDLSTGGDLRAIRAALRAACPVSLGSVPMYEAGCMARARGDAFRNMTAEDMLEAVRLHVRDGVDFVTVHAGITQRAVSYLRENPRLCGVVSRGGSLLARWMVANGQENPLYQHFDEVIAICRETDCSLSLGDALRPGALADAGDRAQIEELYTLGELARRARAAGVQVMIEGPGHVPLNQIAAQMELEKRACDNAPFYVLGPLVTDVAPGYDHLVCAIGGAMAATSGANFLCYVTAAEHLRLPDARDVREGVIAARIAAHAADIANGIPGARDWDDAMSRARKARDWDAMLRLAIDPELARASRARALPQEKDVCSMCGEFCALRGEDFL
jgi:phosphomethylpyrimidine synthase